MSMGESGPEIWDLYDEHGLPTGETHIRGEKIPAGRYHYVVHLCIFNDDGQMLIQQRQPFKKGWANLWDISVGGSACQGESNREGLARECLEELGLELDFGRIEPSVTVRGPDYFDEYYIVHASPRLESLILQVEEVQAVNWAELHEIETLHAEGRFIPYSLSFLGYLFELGTGSVKQNFIV